MLQAILVLCVYSVFDRISNITLSEADFCLFVFFHGDTVENV